MKSVVQEDEMGCGVACVAFILNTNYKSALKLFVSSENKANRIGFICTEIVDALRKTNLNYEYKYIKPKIKKRIYKPNSIVFLMRSKKYPQGHYLCRAEDKWMDPWINFSEKPRKAGFRKRLPEKPIYAILSK